ncbi:MAG: DUF1425 domain-containing protein [Planctomycetes bacterium]|nr:DUF1425 domain-containing protein [Planctomycetota bacterium]
MKNFWIIVAALVLLVSACRTPGVQADAGDTDLTIESKLELIDPRATGSGNTRTLDFALRNTSSKRLEFTYTVDWFDAQGRPVPLSSTAWHVLGIDRQDSAPVRIDPMPKEAVSWRLRFRSIHSR